MNTKRLSSQENRITPRLRERLESLGLMAVMVQPDGQASAVTHVDAAEAKLFQTTLFQDEICQQWMALEKHPGEVVRLWAGLLAVVLPAKRQRRSRIASETEHKKLLLVLIPMAELFKTTKFQILCKQAKEDRKVMASMIMGRGVFTFKEAQTLAKTLSWMRLDAYEIDRRLSELHTMSQQLAETYEELSLLYKLSSNMLVDQSPELFLTDSCEELQQVLGLQWVALQLTDDQTGLGELSGKCFVAGSPECSRDILKFNGLEMIKQSFADAPPMVINDTKKSAIRGLQYLANDLLVVVLRQEERVIAILFGGDKIDHSHISSVDSKLATSLAGSMSIFLQNTILFEDIQATFLGTLHALTNSLDAKDSYTRGHSERVAVLSRELAKAAGMSSHFMERIYISGMIHDIGKIGVPEAVLCKPGRLTDEEFEMIKMHPEIGAHILRNIRQMNDVIPGVLNHHERWDGQGYPFGLQGEDISLIGRMICLADSFDAMSSNRTYRRALKHEDVLTEVKDCSGAQFDPKLAEVFLALDFSEYHMLVERHQSVEPSIANLTGGLK